MSEEADEGRRPAFGGRYLKDEAKVFEHNAWDNVDWDEEHLAQVQSQIQTNSNVKLSPEERIASETKASGHWDDFYQVHQNRFFKDRKWLFTEFPILAELESKEAGEDASMLEVGCGVGNTVFPILEAISRPQFTIYCCDFAPVAVRILQEDRHFDPKRCRPFVCDIGSKDSWGESPVGLDSLDLVTMIFCLSALEPANMEVAVREIFQRLKPGGSVLFRDYGQYDLAQVRFKSGKCLDDNFYVRGDGTRVFFFSQAKVRELFEQAGFVERQNVVDRRLQVNRGKQLKMYRVWVQAQYVRPA